MKAEALSGREDAAARGADSLAAIAAHVRPIVLSVPYVHWCAPGLRLFSPIFAGPLAGCSFTRKAAAVVVLGVALARKTGGLLPQSHGFDGPDSGPGA